MTGSLPPHPTDLRQFSRSLPMVLLRARDSVMGRFRPLFREHGLTEQKWRVLRALDETGQRLRPVELAAWTCLSLPSLSRLLKSLQGLGLIQDNPHAHDLRSTEFALTAAGQALVHELAPQVARRYAEIEQTVGTAEIAAIYDLCERLTQRLGADAGPETETALETDTGADTDTAAPPPRPAACLVGQRALPYNR